MESIIQTLRPVFFVAFFLGTALAYLLTSRFQLRKAYLIVFFTCLILVSLIGAQFLPVVTLHKFVQEGPEERTEYELRVVDANDNELHLDARAIEPVPASRVTVLGDRLVNVYDQADREASSQYILDEARDYRAKIEADPVVRRDRMAFPRHGSGYRWDVESLSNYGNFTAIRVYEVHFRYPENGAEETRSETLAHEYTDRSRESQSAENGEAA